MNAVTNENTNLFIRINMKCYRIHIPKMTLKAIGNPKYIQWGYEPKAKKLMLTSVWHNEKNSVHLHLTKQGVCYVYSKAMLEGIRCVGGVLTADGSYLLKGEKIKQMPAIYFMLEKAIFIDEDDVSL